MSRNRAGTTSRDRFRNSVRLRALAVVVVLAAATSAGASAATAAGTGSITVTPSTALVDGQTVAIEGSDWVPDHVIGFCQGAGDPSNDASGCADGVYASDTADGNGGFSASLVVHRSIYVPHLGVQVDCANPATPCWIGGGDIGDVAGTAVGVNIEFTPPTVVAGGASVVEGNSGTVDLHVPVTLSYPSSQTVTVQWNTVFVNGASDIQADPATDYTPASGTVTFAPGETTKTVTISVNGDTIVEPDEWIVASFHNPTNAKMGGYWGLGFGVITNDD